ncbi:MAG: helix-turn-helix domain-containing protein, partial [Bacilli bacterium]|nr:helix-turn-helix domain-containing protein [Bacilli bacterium]
SVYEFGETGNTSIDDLAYVLGFHIKDFRIKNDITQEELAKKVKIDQGDLSRIEKGSANPSLSTISRIAKGLGAKINISLR